MPEDAKCYVLRPRPDLERPRIYLTFLRLDHTGTLPHLRVADRVREHHPVAGVVQAAELAPLRRQRAVGLAVAALRPGVVERAGRGVRPAGAVRRLEPDRADHL